MLETMMKAEEDWAVPKPPLKARAKRRKEALTAKPAWRPIAGAKRYDT